MRHHVASPPRSPATAIATEPRPASEINQSLQPSVSEPTLRLGSWLNQDDTSTGCGASSSSVRERVRALNAS
jgi:hypothetical protein